MKQEEQLTYEQPQVDIIEVEVEQGFAASENPTGQIDAWKNGGTI